VKALERVVLHPFLFATFPVLYLFEQNIEEGITLDQLIGPLALVLAITTAFFVTMWRIWHDWRRAGLLSSLVALLILSFGHVAQAVEELQELPDDPGAEPAFNAEPYLLPVSGVFAVASVVIALRVKRRLPDITKAMNVIAAALVLMNLVPIVTRGTTLVGSDEPQKGLDASGELNLDARASAKQPDIYYLIFDRYADDEIMRERFDYDNSSFTRWLESRGFHLPRRSSLNYARTGHSLASSLNMRYLDGLARTAGRSATIDAVFRELNYYQAARLLKSLGYRYAHVGSWWPPMNDNPLADDVYRFEALTEFATTLYETTLIAPIADRLGILESLDPRRVEWATRIWQFDTLTKIAEQPGPKFVFGHLLTPHPPYVTDRSGRFVSEERAAEWSYERRYVEQVIYTNGEIKKLIDRLLAVPKAEQPIIILQADEGPHPLRMEDSRGTVFDWTTATHDELEMKFKLFTAMHLPGIPESEVRRHIHPTFTPVNTFRVIFNLYHGGDFRLLPDRNYIFPDSNNPLDFIDVTDRLGIVGHGPERAGLPAPSTG
jgi:hypothetical protein